MRADSAVRPGFTTEIIMRSSRVVSEADNALYRAKTLGRNRIEYAELPETVGVS